MAWYDGVTNFFTGNSEEEAQNAYNQYIAGMKGAKGAYETTVGTALQPYENLVDAESLKFRQQLYLDSLAGLNPQQYKVAGAQTSEINPLDSISSYIDPNVKYQQEAAQRGIEESAAGEGGLFSGSTGSKIATSREELASKAWNEALNKAQNVQESENQRRLAQQNATQSAGTYNFGMDTARSNALGSAFDAAINPLDVITQAKLAQAGTAYGADTGAAGTGYQYGMQLANAPSGWESLIGTIGQVGQAAGGIKKVASLF